MFLKIMSSHRLTCRRKLSQANEQSETKEDYCFKNNNNFTMVLISAFLLCYNNSVIPVWMHNGKNSWSCHLTATRLQVQIPQGGQDTL